MPIFIRVKKILSIKLFEEDNKFWKKSIKDLNLEILSGNYIIVWFVQFHSLHYMQI